MQLMHANSSAVSQIGSVCEYNVTQGETPVCVANPPNCGALPGGALATQHAGSCGQRDRIASF